MALNTQKFIIGLIMINLLIGLTTEALIEEDAFNYDTINNWIGNVDLYNEDAQSETGIWGNVLSTGARIIETTIINPVKYLLIVASIIWTGINPWSFSTAMFENQGEKILATGLQLFRLIVIVIAVLELFFLKQKKTT